MRVEGEVVTVGITDFAQHELGDVVFVELPALGATITKGEAFGVVESVKAVSDIYAPLSGTVTEANEQVSTQPGLLNEDPYGAGWLIKVRPADGTDLAGAMDAAAYHAYTASPESPADGRARGPGAVSPAWAVTSAMSQRAIFFGLLDSRQWCKLSNSVNCPIV
jgi:glycine cleavage system H protein